MCVNVSVLKLESIVKREILKNTCFPTVLICIGKQKYTNHLKNRAVLKS